MTSLKQPRRAPGTRRRVRPERSTPPESRLRYRISVRLRRLEGDVSRLAGMVETGGNWDEVLAQLWAVRGAVGSTIAELLHNVHEEQERATATLVVDSLRELVVLMNRPTPRRW